MDQLITHHNISVVLSTLPRRKTNLIPTIPWDLGSAADRVCCPHKTEDIENNQLNMVKEECALWIHLLPHLNKCVCVCLCVQCFQEFLGSSTYPVFDHRTHEGHWRQLTVRTTRERGGIMGVAEFVVQNTTAVSHLFN